MTRGILIIKWDNEIGAVLLTKYPKTLKITSKRLTNIYANHRIDSSEPSFATLTLKDSKIASFFSGIGENSVGEPNHIVALVLRRDDMPKEFHAILKTGAESILSNIKNKKYEKVITGIFKDMTAIS